MTSPLTPTAAMALFWAGACLLLTVGIAVRSALQIERRLARHKGALDTVLNLRRDHLYGILSRDTALMDLCRRADSATAPAERFTVEREIENVVDRYLLNGAPSLAGVATRPAEALEDLSVWRLRVQAAAIAYDSAASIVCILRRSFPVGLVLRARAAADPPRFGQSL